MAASGSSDISLFRTRDVDPNEVIKEDPTKICTLCHRAHSKYRCPKCSAAYCSADCYKKHNLSCTETFYKDLVETELRTNHLHASAADKRKMHETLQRLHEEEGATQDFFVQGSVEDEAMARLETLALADELTLDHLTEEQRQSFMNAVENGSLAEFIDVWQPFWTQPLPVSGQQGSKEGGSAAAGVATGARTPKIVVLENPIDTSADAAQGSHADTSIDSSEQPKGKGHGIYGSAGGNETGIRVLRNIPPFSQLTKRAPSPDLKFHLLNILFPYCFAARRYNGDWASEPVSALSLIVSLSTVLSHQPRPGTPVLTVTSTAQALQSALDGASARGMQRGEGTGRDFTLAILEDVALVTSHKQYVMLALSHLHALTSMVLETFGGRSEKKAVSPNSPSALRAEGGHAAVDLSSYGSDPRAGARSVGRIQKKVVFFLSWAQSLEPHVFDVLSAEVFTEWSNQVARARQRASSRTTIPVEPVRK
eukprot:TRINITY_DN7211_c0_g2_i1.p1 TRINITY_DN7211_c0_g2~~TRINITY_DN7211_c0_g2_i1.p1  ORF type:complete len:481 (+),score=44.30 TRINITY_DN7211_c0_g2_i1:195-1637(+)